ncbi:uncharacterized protein ARMOST_03178 [Armillaria ostoyae]|uniref:Uncharacterized protein n=1 Tax=Armillaria ostoyae TaxID=47428 RepID=A0A284QTU1_ARMOS|nr:uncharacterized protein ARMOST_03178 [Armillaria ostoyae]
MKSGRKHAHTSEQLWSKSDKRLKTEFDSVFTKSGLPGKKRVSLWQEFVKEKYELLDDETKAQFVQMAEDKAEEIQREKDEDFKVEMLELEETQEAIECLASMLGPLFDSLCELLNLKAGIMFAGPEPVKGGQLNVMFFGTNKAPVPQKFNEAGKSRYKAFTRAFLSFAAEGYDHEEQIACSLPPDQLETKYVEWTMDPTANRVAEEADVDDGNDNNEGGVVSMKKRKKVEEVIPSDRQTKKTRGEKKRRVETVPSSTESPAPEMCMDDTDRHRDPKSKSKHKSRKHGREDTRGATDVEEDDVDVPGIKRKSKKRGRDDIRGATDAEEDNMDVPSPLKHRRTRTVMQVSSPLPEFSEVEHCRGSTTSPIPEPHIDPRLYGLGGEVPLLGPADAPDPFAVLIYECPIVQHNVEELGWTAEDITLLESDPGRSSWFFDAKKYLESIGTGPEWELLLKMWMVYKGRSGFKNETSSQFKCGSCPAEVDWWINQGQEKELPPIVNLKKFELSWWTWWQELQPEWRDKGSGTFSADLRVVKGDWEHMRKPGINRFYTILATLAWWGRTAAIRGSESERASWIASMVDVDWVLRGMLK